MGGPGLYPDSLVLAYLKETSSTSFTLRDLGARLPRWLEDHPEFAPTRHALVLDVARLEWAYVEAFDRFAADPLTSEDFASLGDDSKLFLQPHLQLPDLRYPVDELVLAVHKEVPPSDIASNAVSERKQKSRSGLPRMRRSAIHLAVHRFDNSVFYRRIEREAFLLLAALQQRHTLASSTANVIGAQQNSCPQGVDANSGFSSITPTGLAPGSSGSIAVSFSHGSYNGFGVTVPYGPYSTPESIASHLAALITKQHASSGLMAQADGANILYKSNTALGNANFTASGSSFSANPSPAVCPSVNLTYILAVTTGSVNWVLIPNSGGQQGRSLTYVLVKKPTADLPTNLFNRVSPPNSISEHFTKPGPDWKESTNTDTGEFDDGLGTASICSTCIIGTGKNYRYFTGTLNNQDLGTLLIYDQTGAHEFDYIQIIHPNGPTILNHWTTIPNGTIPKDISLPNTF